jgi:hypothetical protein
MGIPVVRLIFGYDGEEVTLLSQQRMEMALPPGDLDMPTDREGFWIELRRADGEVIDRRVVRDPLLREVEVFSPERAPRWVPVDRPQGAFTVVVPDRPEADYVALVATGTRAIEPRSSGPGPHEVARFALEPGPSEDA